MGQYESTLSQEELELKNDEKFEMAYRWIKDKCDAYKREVEHECLTASKAIEPLPGKLPIMALVGFNSDVNVKSKMCDDHAISNAIFSAIDAIWPPSDASDLDDDEAKDAQLQAQNRRNAVCSVVKNVAKVFLGKSKVSTSSSLSEKISYKVIWSNNSLLRLDIYFAEKEIHSKAGHDPGSGKESHLTVVGHMMIASICDIRKVQPEVIVYELSEYLSQMVAIGGPTAKKSILDEIEGAKEIVLKVGNLYDVVSSMQKKMEIEEVIKMTKETKLTVPKQQDNSNHETDTNEHS